MKSNMSYHLRWLALVILCTLCAYFVAHMPLLSSLLLGFSVPTLVFYGGRIRFRR
jgi:hypothetical protein